MHTKMTASLIVLAALVVLAGANVIPMRCPCSRQLEPTCGTDGITYSNACMLKCASTVGSSTKGSDLRVAHKGACARRTENKLPMRCPCSRQLEPTCGTDGITYPNACMLKCASMVGSSIKGSELRVAHKGACAKRTESKFAAVAAEPAHLLCMCRQVWNPVCGSDGVTYTNICALRCKAGRKAKGAGGLQMDHEGAC